MLLAMRYKNPRRWRIFLPSTSSDHTRQKASCAISRARSLEKSRKEQWRKSGVHSFSYSLMKLSSILREGIAKIVHRTVRMPITKPVFFILCKNRRRMPSTTVHAKHIRCCLLFSLSQPHEKFHKNSRWHRTHVLRVCNKCCDNIRSRN